MHNDIHRILYHETTILARLDEMAHEIALFYRGKPLTVVAILNGSLFFMADLLRRIPIPLQVESLQASSYRGTRSTGTVTMDDGDLPDVSGRHVLLLDDILDSGRTLAAVRRRFLEDGRAAGVRSCVLLSKNIPRAEEVEVDYIGFGIENEFVVGYGLDYNEHYRNLPYIGVLHADITKDEDAAG